MKNIYHIFKFLLVATVLLSCSQDGLEGPEGPAGATGAIGAAGKDGSIIYSGTGVPATTLGANGDYYLDRSAGNLYGPKIATGWGNPLSIIGAQGAQGTQGANGTNGTNGTNGANGTNGTNGTNGSTTLSGTGAPALSLGSNGDYYLDKTAYLLYGPKNTNGWGTAILLRGADGAQGPMGPAGKDGTVIYGGDYFPDPALGKIGDFFIGRYTVSMYGPKTASGWGNATSLRGANGTNGTNGTNGANGNSVLSGRGVPMATLGTDGDFYIDIATYMIYGPKRDGLWGNGTSLRGADGGSGAMAFETSEASTFSWISKFNFFDGFNFKLLTDRHSTFNDTTSVFAIPVAAVEAARTGSVLVYVRLLSRDVNKKWMPLSFTSYDSGSAQYFTNSLTVSETGVAVRIFGSRTSDDELLMDFDRVRIVVSPAAITSILNPVSSMPMAETMRKFGIGEGDFIKLK